MSEILFFAATGGSAKDIIIACLVLICLLILLYVGVTLYRKHWMQDDEGDSGTPFTLADLRDMRDRGDISETEYKSMRGAIIGEVRGEGSDSSSQTPDNNDAVQ